MSDGQDRLLEVIVEMMLLAPAGFAAGVGITHIAARFLFVSYPKVWREHYAVQEFAMVDPTVRWAVTHDGTMRWSQLAHEDPAGVMRQARAHGLRHGITVSHLIGGQRLAAGFTRPDRDFTDREAGDLARLLQELHVRAIAAGGLTDDLHRRMRNLDIEAREMQSL